MYIESFNPYASKIGGVNVPWHGIVMVMAIRGKPAGYDPDGLSNVLLWTVVWGLAFEGAVGFGLFAFWMQLRHRPMLFNYTMDGVVTGHCTENL